PCRRRRGLQRRSPPAAPRGRPTPGAGTTPSGACATPSRSPCASSGVWLHLPAPSTWLSPGSAGPKNPRRVEPPAAPPWLLDGDPVLAGELTAGLFANEVVGLALPLEGGAGGEVREPDLRDRVLDHVIFQVYLAIPQGEVRPHEVQDPIVDPLRDGFLVDLVQGELQLGVRLEPQEDRDNIQVVAQDQLPDVPVRRCGELEADARQSRLKLEGRLSGRGHDPRRRLDVVPELLDQDLQARPPEVAQLVEDLAELLQALLAPAVVLQAFCPELVHLLRDGR